MNWGDFAGWSKHTVDWRAQYHKTRRDRPVRAQTKPGEIASQLPAHPPQTPEDMTAILADLEDILMPGMTHWQHPRFFAYFPANAAHPTMLAEQLVNTVAAQCMLLQTSPTATEIEALASKGRLRFYCSDQVHSSIDRTAWVAGTGQGNLVKIAGSGAFHDMGGIRNDLP